MPGHAKTLNPRQIKFAQNVALGAMDRKTAAILAGYKDSPFSDITAARIAKQPIVKAEIDRLLATSRASLALTAETWRQELTGRYLHIRDNGSDSDALRALELWGKHLGLLDTKRDDESADAAKQVLATFAAIVARSQPRPELPTTIEGSYRAIVDDTGPATLT